MYRGSRLAASFLLLLTGFAAAAAALFVVLPAATGAAGWLIPVAILFAIGHWAAIVGLARGRDWGRNLAVFVAELGGGLAILGGHRAPDGCPSVRCREAAGPGLVAWARRVYTLLGIAAGRVPVVARLSPIERRRAVFGPSFAGIAAGLGLAGAAPRRRGATGAASGARPGPERPG